MRIMVIDCVETDCTLKCDRVWIPFLSIVPVDRGQASENTVSGSSGLHERLLDPV